MDFSAPPLRSLRWLKCTRIFYRRDAENAEKAQRLKLVISKPSEVTYDNAG